MERLTKYICERAHGSEGVSSEKLAGAYCRGKFEATAIVERLAVIEDILGDEYDLNRLRDLVQADRDGRCVVLQVKPGEKVRPKQNPYRKPEIVDCVTIYTGGRITYGFHEIGNKVEWVDRWEEDDAKAYIPDEPKES